jgi:hypothetical protein
MRAIREKPEECAAEARVARLRAVLDGVAPGTRIVIRVIAGVLAGRFIDATSAHVRLALRAGEVRVPLDAIETIEIAPSGEVRWRGRCSSTNDDDEGDDK